MLEFLRSYRIWIVVIGGFLLFLAFRFGRRSASMGHQGHAEQMGEPVPAGKPVDSPRRRGGCC